MTIKARVAALRALMKKNRLHAYLIPSADAHLNEYVPTFWRRREWISGFTGSAGDVVITLKKAALWTDSRYFLQAGDQLAGSGITLMKLGVPGTPTIPLWLSKQLRKGQRVGVDPRVLSLAQFARLKGELADFSIELVPLERNLVDALWEDQPPAPVGPVEVHPVKYAGERFQDKIKRVRKAMRDAGARAHVVSALDCVAWLFNIRGSDVQHNPVVIAYAIITEKKATLFVDRKKVTPELRRAFGKSAEIRDYAAFRAALIRLARSGGPVLLDPAATSQWIAGLLSPRTKLILRESPIMLMKAAKNSAELRGMRRAHVRDGVAMVKFLYWLEQSLGRRRISEITIAEKLEELRSRSRLFRGLSFDTIVGYGPHGAVIHYSATPETDVPIRRKGLMIVDSGAQYLDGTTDITRTLCLSAPTLGQKNEYTRVLKGHIQVALTSFPVGASGRQLDTLARKALWDAGLDYGHGTGHGVGAYLSVHEGPQSISNRDTAGTPLAPGMVLSNEPGYYQAGEYGIRIENLVYVTRDKEHSTRERIFLKFENLTLCPIETRPIDTRLLTREELRYFNAYHVRVRRELTRFLTKPEAAWLKKATRPIG
ncbi:MAG: aminopeptidase P family protein [bacterium]|nr:aminopeptidase P family protein [bacterium]